MNPEVSCNSVGFVSLGCSKALVDSELIITELKASGYEIVPSYQDANLVVVNTCGFIDSAIEESISVICEAIDLTGRVIVTGCLGKKTMPDGESLILTRIPKVLGVVGPNSTQETVALVRKHLPLAKDKKLVLTKSLADGSTFSINQDSIIPYHGLKLTPRHYAYLKISEGCNQKCSFCIIPSMRGKLISRPIVEILNEARSLVNSGVKEIIVISQDTGAYGADLRYKTEFFEGRPVKTSLIGLLFELKKLKVWIRLHYLYPYKFLDNIIPMMTVSSENKSSKWEQYSLLPYIDIPFQHAHPEILNKMRRPANYENTLERIASWREICPDLTIRSTFIVGFPGETNEHFSFLIDFLKVAKLDRVGCFIYSSVDGAAANTLPKPVDKNEQIERKDIFMEVQKEISKSRLKRWLNREIFVLIDSVDLESNCLIARSTGDSPEIDGKVKVYAPPQSSPKVTIGEIAKVRITASDEYDLVGEYID
tara:strand:- start:25280 stop:26722 length:1443 start_codon:yes stop_codon:yes gene_type:complete